MGFCQGGVLSCGVLSVWDFVLWGFVLDSNEAHIVHVQKALYQSVCETFSIYCPYGSIPLKGGQYRNYILLHW